MGANAAQSDWGSPQFLERIRSRDPSVLEELVHSYTEPLLKGAIALGFDRNLAKELVQSTWAAFFDTASRFEGRSHIRTYLFGILYNKASELRREDKKFESADPVEEVLEKRFDQAGRWIQPPQDPERFLIATETMDLIEKCLEKLPLAQRMAFCMKEVEEHGSSDICKILNVTVTNLGVLLYRARNRLRECIENKSKV